MILENALEALLVVMDPIRFSFIILGVLIGLIIGVIPGIGGLVGLALALPFTVTMDHYTALGFLIGLSAVTATSDTIPAPLCRVPTAAPHLATCPASSCRAAFWLAGQGLPRCYRGPRFGGR